MSDSITKENNAVTNSATMNLGFETTISTNTGIGAIAIKVTVEFDKIAVGLQIKQDDATVGLRLDDDTAHELGIALIGAARQITAYGYED